MFFCKFSEISKNSIFTEQLWATASYSPFIVIPKEKYVVAHSISSRHLLQVTSLQGNLPQNILEVTHVCSCKTLEKSKKAWEGELHFINSLD